MNVMDEVGMLTASCWFMRLCCSCGHSQWKCDWGRLSNAGRQSALAVFAGTRGDPVERLDHWIIGEHCFELVTVRDTFTPDALKLS